MPDQFAVLLILGQRHSLSTTCSASSSGLQSQSICSSLKHMTNGKQSTSTYVMADNTYVCTARNQPFREFISLDKICEGKEEFSD